MKKTLFTVAGGILALLFSLSTARAVPLELTEIQFPERSGVDVDFLARPGAPEAVIKGKVEYREGQARVDLSYRGMKPAILFGGDVTCFVLWAVSMDGHAANLGEFVVPDREHSIEFSTAKKAFALMITAEPYYLVTRPSELVVFFNGAARNKKVVQNSFTYSGAAPAPEHAMASITDISWDSNTPLDLLQARKAFELAGRRGASKFAPLVYQDAGAALEEANRIAEKSPRSKNLLDQARRSVALSNTAINIAQSREQAAEIERQVAQRREETKALELRAADAEMKARQTLEEAEQARAEVEDLRQEKDRISQETAALSQDKLTLESSLLEMRAERERLSREKDELSSRLQGALSTVAATKKSAEGYVVSLPDILFDLNQATLKDEARLVLAKLSGILVVMPDLTMHVEGHTDSTGSEEYNQRLSEKRAQAVMDFIAEQSVSTDRLTFKGYGMDRPIGDNSTADGRRQNRRVEILIDENVD